MKLNDTVCFFLKAGKYLFIWRSWKKLFLNTSISLLTKNILYSLKQIQSFKQKLVFSNWFMKCWWIHAISLGQCFDKLSLNTDSCQIAVCRYSGFTSIESELRDLNTT